MRDARLKGAVSNRDRCCRRGLSKASWVWIAIVSILTVSLALQPLWARSKNSSPYGEPIILNLPFPESIVEQVIEDVVQDGIIRGTKEYNKDEYVKGATVGTSTRAFKEWTEGGKVFYKVRLKALDPLNFKDANDVGTLAVRYIVQPQGDKNTVLRVEAVFVEDFRHVTHLSNGSVETAELKDIHDRLEAIESMKNQTIEAEKEKQEQLAKKWQTPLVDESSRSVTAANPVDAVQPTPAQPPATTPATAGTPIESTPSLQNSSSSQTLDERVQDLRRQVERLVKKPGAPLKSAPFHTASTLESLPPGTEVLIVVTSPYWLGVETHEGQHGWMLRDELELLP